MNVSKGFLNGIVFIGVIAAIVLALFAVKSGYEAKAFSNQATSAALDLRVKNLDAFLMQYGAFAQGYFNYHYRNLERVYDENGADAVRACCSNAAYIDGNASFGSGSSSGVARCRLDDNSVSQALDENIGAQFEVVSRALKPDENACNSTAGSGCMTTVVETEAPVEVFDSNTLVFSGDLFFATLRAHARCVTCTRIADAVPGEKSQKLTFNTNYRLYEAPRFQHVDINNNIGETAVVQDANNNPVCNDLETLEWARAKCACPNSTGSLPTDCTTQEPGEDASCKIECTYRAFSSCEVHLFDPDGFEDKNGAFKYYREKGSQEFSYFVDSSTGAPVSPS